ncbi:2-C-methyl-D-erythritol 4-phosphate cytidylyltransferase [Algoriphagus namhaensis]|uniref:2-C-methyl-D-erythritol 4-phosphate cytidylyltransferase n=1 Tax=Algoriphagus namhaensis TaxID=915353 RepID=A0ABV8AP90_9BACT
MEKYAVIVAGGKGTRMGTDLPKQYLPIKGLPVLMRSIQKFHLAEPLCKLILVIPSVDFEFWKGLCAKYDFAVPHQVVAGGTSRFQSVSNGLAVIEGTEGVVAIHDGVRPFVAVEVIQESFLVAKKDGSAIAVVPLKDSLRKLTDSGESFFQERQQFRLVQTPQTFQVSKIKKAFEVEEIPQFTDDATVYEFQGWQVSLIDGNLENIKITTPDDLSYAEYLLSKVG